MLKSTFSALLCWCSQYGSIFIRLAVVVSHICEISRNTPKIQTYSSSRSSILVPIESAYATSY